MRVIKRNDVEKTHKCDKCKSVYAYTSKDVDYFWTPTMKCPVCESINYPSIFDRNVT